MSEAAQNLPAIVDPTRVGAIVEAVIVRGDLENLTPQQRTTYYNEVCTSMGLNPLTRPLDFIKLNGKLTLYALKNATDQLRRIYGVSISDVTQEREGDLLIVTAKARDQQGRTDVSKGALVLKGLTGENLANAIMKCETKAKRRVTLSICGMGFLDETEVETISNAQTPRLPKKDARDIYTRMQAEVDEAADVEDWLLKNEGRMLVLPADWENILRLRIQERQQTPPAANEPTELWTDGETPPEWSSKWDALSPVTQAGILCKETDFWNFLSGRATGPVASIDQAVDYVHIYCKIASRKELATSDPAVRLWRNLVASYRAWQREPSVTASPTGVSDAADTPPAQAHPEAGGDVPSAEQYTATWDGILNAATPRQYAQIGNSWNEQNGLRGQIDWTEKHPFSVLKKRVMAALDMLKAEIEAAEAGA